MRKKKPENTNGKPTKKAAQSTTGRFVQAKKTKKKLTANEVFLKAWQYSSDHRDKRVA